MRTLLLYLALVTTLLAFCSACGGDAASPRLDTTGDVAGELRDVSGAQDSGLVATDLVLADLAAIEVLSDRIVDDGGEVELDAASSLCSSDGDCVGRVSDLDPCERAACDTRWGLCVAVRSADGDSCDDGDACTEATVCRAGRCVGRVVRCDDGDPCTESRCDHDAGCVHTPRVGPCEREVCAPGTPPIVCPAFDGGCRASLCDPETGACVDTPLPDGYPCDDGDACTLVDTCRLGVCRSGPARSCDDGDLCTADRCDPVVGCLFPPTLSLCDDGDPCTESDRCERGVCVPGHNDCLDETCEPARRIGCGEVDAWFRDAPDGTDVVADYACGASGLDGPELTWSFVARADGVAHATLVDAAPETRLLLLEAARRGCDAGACRAVTTDELSFPVTAGHSYYLVADAPSGAAMDVTVGLACELPTEALCDDGVDDDRDGRTDCDDPDCVERCDESPCAPIWTLVCDTPLAGRTDGAGGTQRRTVYGCGAGLRTLPGPETSFAFVAPADGRYELALSGTTAPLDVVVLRGGAAGCRSGACVARGAGQVAFDAERGERLEIVVDGADEAGAAFVLTTRCPDDIERRCADGLDDDGDGATDCADEDCAGDPTCAAGCAPLGVARCGDVIVSTTDRPGHTQALRDYACGLFPFEGPEVAWRVEAPAGTHVTARLVEGSRDLGVFLLASPEADRCVGSDCRSHAGDSASLVVADEGLTLVVVDGYGDAAGPFVLRIDCAEEHEEDCTDGVDDDGDGATDCLDDDCFPGPSCPSCDALVTDALACDTSVALSTRAQTATSGVARYGCNANDYAGPERIYSFEPGWGGVVTLSLGDESGPLDILLLEDQGAGCNPAACERMSPYRVRFRAAGGRRYYVAIDGYGGGEGGATLVVDCEDQ